MITSENVVFRSRFNDFRQKSCSVSEIFDILNCSINFESCDVIMSISTRDRVVHEFIFRISSHLDMKLCWLINTVMGNIFRKKICMVSRLGFRSRPFSIYQLNTINRKIIVIAYGFLLFWKCALRRSKIVLSKS